jgi:hypothetical protein
MEVNMNKKNYHDLADITKQPEILRDFEGITDPAQTLRSCLVKKNTWVWDIVCPNDKDDDLRRRVRDITLNLIYERADQGDIILNTSEILELATVVHELLTVRYWMKVEDEDIAHIIGG